MDKNDQQVVWYRFGQKKGSMLSRDISYTHMFKVPYLAKIPYFGFWIRHYKYINWTHYTDKEEMEQTCAVLLSKMLKARNLSNFKKFALEKERKIKIYCKFLDSHVTPETPAHELIKLFNKWIVLKGWADVIVPCGNFLVRTLSQETERLAKKYFSTLPEQQLKEQLVLLAYNGKETAFYSREKELLRLAIKLRKYVKKDYNKLPKRVQNLIKLFNTKYGWMTVMFLIHSPVTSESTWKEIRGLQKSKPEKRLKNLALIKKQIVRQRLTILKSIKPDKKFLQVLNLLRESSFIEANIVKAFQLSSYHSLPFLHKIAKRLGLSYNNLIYLRHEEIIKAIKTGKLPSKDTINERKTCFGFFANLDKDVAEFLDAKQIKNFMESPRNTNKTIIKGMTASPGKARGRVRLVLDTAQIPKFKPREILVTTMTTPNFVVAMKKAAAIITNDGGITCHAAIVSRELRKPCIIGTKIATDILKDGDRVEVDADKGSIKRLNK